jgi:2-dehydro-3-deoxyphosphogluconate aldolase/(4S)-4-hydroxy-2-oxoglutarate aldolase
MSETSDVASAILALKAIAIIREKDEKSARAEAIRLLGSGIRIVEVSLTTPGALDTIAWLQESEGDPDRHIGVGTVLTPADVDRAKSAGAEFIVSPISSPALLESARQHGLTSVVGALTPTECYNAATAGADFVKLFPATLWSPKEMAGMLQALPALRLVPTGGVTLETAPEWIASGAVALGLGGALRREPAARITERLAALAASPVR